MNLFSIRLLILMICWPMLVQAAVPTWQIIPDKSSLSFTAMQNNSPVTGKFTKFTGEIQADPNQLDDSRVIIFVDIGSVSTTYSQISQTLKTPAWFDVKVFPQAIFKTNKIIKVGEHAYQANGTLTLRNKTVPVILHFNLDEYTAERARVSGSTTLKRTAFGVGSGEWTSTEEVKDPVRVDFILTVKKK